MFRTRFPIRLALLLLACFAPLVSCGGESARPTIHLVVEASQEALFRDYVEGLGETVVVEVSDEPQVRAREVAGIGVAVVVSSSGDGGYRLERLGSDYAVHGDAPLGVQYGVSDLLERLGFRFFHPFDTAIPERLATIPDAAFGVEHSPDRAVRGLHLHILHPIEGYFDFWEPGSSQLARAERVIDWLVKNRGNYLQYTGLDDIQRDDALRDAWADHTRAILGLAHARGVRVGMGIQLFGASNLQSAYDLVEEDDDDFDAAVAARLDRIDDVPFDAVQLSFGEFIGVDPVTFVGELDDTVAAIRTRWPSAQVSTVVHVGNFSDLQVDYMGETLNYYYLVRYAADPALVPYIHTVMYYGLYEDAGGAYGYDLFDDHRAFLYERLLADEPVAYFPETAYWIAFDNSIPTYLPLYVRNRWLDLERSRADGATMGFDADFDHVLFSTGWEWGYWQNDWAALRSSYELPATYESLFETMLEPWGEPGAALASRLVELTEIQKEGLTDDRLAAYVASRDWTFDLGDSIGVFSQPRRTSYPAIAAMNPTERAAFRADVVTPLGTFLDRLVANRAAIEALDLPADDRWIAEIRDGVAANVERVGFAHALLEAVLAHAEGDAVAAAASIAEAETYQARAAEVVNRRHRSMHYPDAESTILAIERPNATAYDYGYLREAVTQCFYERERREVRNLVEGTTLEIPFCAIL